MEKYPKIQSIFKRDNKGNFTHEFSDDNFEYLFNNMWIGKEKIDGTNIRVGWNGYEIDIRGRTDKAQIQPSLMNVLQNLFTKDSFENVFGTHTENGEKLPEIILFGEGYGNGIQKGGGGYREDQGFILFDVKIDKMWLKPDAVKDIATRFNIPFAPIVFEGNLKQAIEFAKIGFYSEVAQNSNKKAEGLVLLPKVEFLDRRGFRVITKVKEKDFG